MAQKNETSALMGATVVYFSEGPSLQAVTDRAVFSLSPTVYGVNHWASNRDPLNRDPFNRDPFNRDPLNSMYSQGTSYFHPLRACTPEFYSNPKVTCPTLLSPEFSSLKPRSYMSVVSGDENSAKHR